MSDGARLTVGSLRRRIASDLTAAFAQRHYDGTPALDARMLVAHVMGIAPLEVPLRDDEAVSDDVCNAALRYAAHRGRGKPVARIVGRKEFHGHDFVLSAETLVPRPDTETLVDAALALIAPDARVTVVDIGTGTGAILLSVLAARPNALGVGIDIAAGAIATARENARRLDLAERSLLVVGDWLAPIGQADFILANPPYIEGGAIAGLDAEVRDHDPHLALGGGADGLDAIRIVLGDLDRVMATDGYAFIEIGAGQASAVAALSDEAGFCATFVTDLAGHDRVAVLMRRGKPPKFALGNRPGTG